MNVIKLAGAVACGAVLLSGCSQVATVKNKGGDTTCAEFKVMSTQDQESVIKLMLQKDDGKEPSNLDVSGTRISAVAFCETLGKDSSKISEINHG